MSGPNTGALPPSRPPRTHVVLTEELIEQYKAAVPYWTEAMWQQALGALNDVAPAIYQAGWDAAMSRVRPL